MTDGQEISSSLDVDVDNVGIQTELLFSALTMGQPLLHTSVHEGSQVALTALQ